MNNYSVTNFYEGIEFSKDKVMVKKILETSVSKEIRICLSKNQLMKEHTAPAPIIVMVMDGAIKFNVENKEFILIKGSSINLGAKIPHSLLGLEDSIIRLSLAQTPTN
jgi:quercetin dioxygenase-like cupin family protein